jgi:PAS domain S-box-containing protein
LSENRFIDVNPSFLRMSGYTAAEVIGHTASELKLGIAQAIYQQVVQNLLTKGSLHNQECEFRAKSGEIRNVLLSVELTDLNGVACTLNSINDITERKRIENEFISLVSHELRTPLTSIMGSLDLLGSGQLGCLDARGESVLQIATSNCERLIRLVNDILDLERMKSGRIPLRQIDCDVVKLLRQATEAMQAMAQQAQVAIVIQQSDQTLDNRSDIDPLIIHADPDRILQALTNLLNNAIKFSDAGGTVQASITVASAQPGSNGDPQAHIRFQDEGRGIPPDKLETIFERFQQVDASDSRAKGGTGLGLAICRNIIQQHEGRIWAESTLGEGSTFHVTLPLVGYLTPITAESS